MKAALCVNCTDIIAPLRAWQTTRAWRWCQCDRVGVRWRDGAKGLLEVACSDGPAHVRVIGFNNTYLQLVVWGNLAGMPVAAPKTAEEWRTLHDASCEGVEPHYLFHKDKRNCWAVIIRPGQTGDVFLIDYDTAKAEEPPPPV